MDLQEFRERFSQMKAAARSPEAFRSSLLSFLEVYRTCLPLFPENNLVLIDGKTRAYRFNGEVYEREYKFYGASGVEEIFVDPLLCVGTTWLYENDRSYGRPKPERMVISLSCPTTEAPPVPSSRMGDRYVCNDGNHRIYAAYLLGEKVKIGVEGIHPLIEQ